MNAMSQSAGSKWSLCNDSGNRKDTNLHSDQSC